MFVSCSDKGPGINRVSEANDLLCRLASYSVPLQYVQSSFLYGVCFGSGRFMPILRNLSTWKLSSVRVFFWRLSRTRVSEQWVYMKHL